MKKDFHKFLHERFQAFRKRNPRFSKRSFARRLGVDQSLLTKIFSGKRQASAKFIEKAGRRLGLTSKEITDFAASSFNEIIFDWRNFAILELLSVEEVEYKPARIAELIGISIADVEASVSNLAALGYIRLKNNRLALSATKTYWARDARVLSARKMFYQHLLVRALKTIDKKSPEGEPSL